jgi:membrane dipeptidase
MRYLLFLSVFLLPACRSTRNLPPEALLKHARELLATTPIVDTHIDFPEHMSEHKKWFKPGYEAWAVNNPDGDFDWTRARQGGLSAPFMSIYIPSPTQLEKGRPKQLADSLINLVYGVVKGNPDKFALVTRASDIERNFAKGLISLPMGMENGAPIETLADVAYYYKRGIRYVTLTHAKDNQISDSSYDTKHTNGGLSSYGKDVVKEMNRVGMLVDVSHLSDDAIRDVVKVARKPLIATHSGCRYFTPGFERNLNDTLIRAIAQTNGVIQIPFSMFFLRGDSRDAWHKAEAALAAKKTITDGTPEARKFYQEYATSTGLPLYLTVREVADHIDHIVHIAGIDHVGFGSDFDGVGLALPHDLADVSMYPNLIAELIRRGYSDKAIKKICYGNVLRVWRANEVAGAQ